MGFLPPPSVVRQCLRIIEVTFACFAPLMFVGHFAAEDLVVGLLQFIILVATPMAPFVLICLAVYKRRGAGNYQYHSVELLGATLGAAVSLYLPARFAWESLHRDYGAGANIGVGMILFFMPVYVPLALALGYYLGKLLWMSFAFYPYILGILGRCLSWRSNGP